MKNNSSPSFTIKPLSSDIDCSSFCCSDSALNEYLFEDALRDHEFLYSITKIVECNGKVAGYFTLVSDTVNPDFLDEEVGKKYKYSKMPAIKIARLATDKDFVGKGLGSAMMAEIFYIVLSMIKDVGCRVITVDSKKNAQTFYERFSFQLVQSKKTYETIPMYLDIKDLIAISKKS